MGNPQAEVEIAVEAPILKTPAQILSSSFLEILAREGTYLPLQNTLSAAFQVLKEEGHIIIPRKDVTGEALAQTFHESTSELPWELLDQNIKNELSKIFQTLLDKKIVCVSV